MHGETGKKGTDRKQISKEHRQHITFVSFPKSPQSTGQDEQKPVLRSKPTDEMPLEVSLYLDNKARPSRS